MKEDKKIYILDTSALLTYIEDEEGSQYVEDLLIKAEALRRIKLIQSLAVKVEESNENLNMRAGSLKAANRISLADAYIAALCQELKGILVHKDPEFEKMSPPVKEFRLLYKTC